ncbi:MAG: GTPase HflX [Bosea sp. (in: a-proteobacteria)]
MSFNERARKGPGAPKSDKDIEREIAAGTRTLVLGPYLTKRGVKAAAVFSRTPDARLAEAVGLAAAIELDVVGAELVSLAAPRPATYLGKGKVEEFTARIQADEIALVVVDAPLTPVQQRNLEKAWSCKVIDRTGLILDIFGSRAQTREGVLQVELAHLAYQKSRLVRSWTHLERQRGGFGFLGGPGETQIEADRRLIQDRMIRIERELEEVKRTRGLHRASRKRVPYPIVALVGYTNAGKSTLFNRLTRAEVLAADMLFATLDPTARAVKLPQGATVMLSDTVGFISELPTQLIAAFRATLEDAIEADLILHVRDLAHEDTEAQAEDVVAVLESLGVAGPKLPKPGQAAGKPVIEVWNKADLLAPADRERHAGLAEHRTEPERAVLVSALTGEGIEALRSRIEALVTAEMKQIKVAVPADDGEGLAWLYRQGDVLARRARKDGTTVISLRANADRIPKIASRFKLLK